MTLEEIKSLPDDELYKLSLQKDKKGRYTWDAEIAYGERYRRSGIVRYAGVSHRCDKFQSDIDYYGRYV